MKKERLGIGYGGGRFLVCRTNHPQRRTEWREGRERKRKRNWWRERKKKNKRVEVMKWEGEKGGLRKEVPLW